jgi:hypothetical protein
MGFGQSIQRPRSNPLKLSEFVPVSALIIPVISLAELEPISIKIQIRYFFGFLQKHFFLKKINDYSS